MKKTRIMTKMRRFFLFGWVCTMFTACLGNDETEFEKRQKEEEKILSDYFAENSIEATRGQYGVYYEEINESSGTEVKEKEIVSIYYKMYTLAGDEIASVEAGTDEPVRFVHSPTSSAYNMIPKGIDLGVAYMSAGDTYRFYIPSYYAFGAYSTTNVIPERAILKVELTVADIQTEAEVLEIEKDSIEAYLVAQNIEDYKTFASGLYYKRTKEGSGNNPSQGQTVTVHYIGKYLDGTEFDSTEPNDPLEIPNFGSGDLIEGFEDGLAEMKEGEEGILIIPSKLAYGGGVQIVPEQIREDYLEENELRDIPPFAPLVFELKVVDIQ